jgi:hypothetical protein
MPVSDGEITDDLDLPVAVTVISVGQVALSLRRLPQASHKIHDPPPLAARLGNRIKQSHVKVDISHLHLAMLSLVQLPLKLIHRQPMSLVCVIDSLIHDIAVSWLITVPKMKQESSQLILLQRTQNGDFLFDLFDTH